MLRQFPLPGVARPAPEPARPVLGSGGDRTRLDAAPEEFAIGAARRISLDLPGDQPSILLQCLKLKAHALSAALPVGL